MAREVIGSGHCTKHGSGSINNKSGSNRSVRNSDTGSDNGSEKRNNGNHASGSGSSGRMVEVEVVSSVAVMAIVMGRAAGNMDMAMVPVRCIGNFYA